MLELVTTYGTWPLLLLLLAGAAIGLVGGLLGIGGGVLAVPVLLEIFAAPELARADQTALAVGTSQAVVLLSSIVAARAHGRAGNIDWPILRAWLPAILTGAILGLLAAPYAPPAVSLAIFASLTLLLGVKMWLGERLEIAAPSPPLAWLPPGLIGVASAALGVGAGTLSGPVLGLFGVELRRVIGAGAMFNLAVALPATLAFLRSGWGQPGMPADALGHVSLSALVLLALPAALTAPAAARLGGRLPVLVLERCFALCLFAISARLAYRAVA